MSVLLRIVVGLALDEGEQKQPNAAAADTMENDQGASA
jgi:hypothetical protein